MAKPKADPKDPRYRGFRIAAYAVYLTVVGVFSILVIWSVFKSVVAMSPSAPRDQTRVLTVGECVKEADRMWGLLEDQRQRFSEQKPSEKVDEHFTRFRMKWLKDLRELEGRCAVDSDQRSKLKAAFNRLERLLDLYMTHAVQFAGEVGPQIDKFDLAMEEARKEAKGR